MPRTVRNRIVRAAEWRKCLYVKQDGYEDNYSDEQFLQGLRKNVSVQRYSLGDAVRGSCAVTLQTSVVVLYAATFALVFLQQLPTSTLLSLCTLGAVAGYSFYQWSTSWLWAASPGHTRTLLFYLGWLWAASPLVRTLSASVSTDTIYATAVLMFLLNLIFYDYGVDVAVVSRPISINAAIFASVCLTSRLSSDFESFLMLTLAVECFALWPPLSKRLVPSTTANQSAVLLLSLLVALADCAVLLYLSATEVLILYVLQHLAINLLCPLLLIALQPLKNTIHGPWDEADLNY